MGAKKEKTTLSILIKDELINKGNASNTFTHIINHISNTVGKEQLCKDFPLVFNTNEFINTKDNTKYNSGKDDSSQYYIRTHSSTENKKYILDKILDFYKIEAVVNIENDNESSSKSKYWIYSPGNNGDRWEEFYGLGIMALGWELGDLTNLSKEEISQKLQGDGDSTKKNDTVANFDFKTNISIGDIIIVKKGRNELIGYGEVISDYYYDESREDFKSCRKVNWIKKGSWKTENMLVLKTLTDITKYDNSLKLENDGIKYYQTLMDIMVDNSIDVLEEFEIKETKNPFGGVENTSSLCVTGDSGTGKSYRIEETLKNESHEYIFENYDATSTGLLTTFNNGIFEINNIGQFIIDASKNLHKNYTIILDEVQKEDFLAKINNELFHCLSSKRNGGTRYIATNKVTDHLFQDLPSKNGRRIVPRNLGFILITSKSDVVHNDDIKNRLQFVNLTLDNRDLKFNIESLESLIEEENYEYSVE